MSDTHSPELPASAPAVIDDTLPGGPRWMHNLGDKPVWIETKSQLKREMELRGLVPAPRDRYEKHDQSPWATRDRLRPGARDPFVHPVEGAPPPPLPEAPPAFEPEALPLGQMRAADTRGTVATTEGDIALPAFLFSAADQRIIRTYRTWLNASKLQPQLFCGHCWDVTPGDQIAVGVSPHDITMVCRCRLRYGNGETPFMPLPAVSPPAILAGVLPEIPLSIEVARLFRTYKRVLQQFQLKEALRCLNCWGLGLWDGCRGIVLDNSILIECRCCKRTYMGPTY